MTNITFSNSKPLGTRHEAFATITLNGRRTSFMIALVLVDSGAEYLMLPMTAASTAGVSLAGATLKTIRGIGGTSTAHLVSGVSVNVEGVTITTDVLFYPPSSSARPLLGRKAFRAVASAIGFDAIDWLW